IRLSSYDLLSALSSFSCLRSTNLDMTILTSYRMRIGTDTTIWLAISGGVITAESMSTITRATFRYFFRNYGVTSPMLDMKNMMIGNSKINPQEITEARTVAI